MDASYSIFRVRRDRSRSPRTGAVHEFVVVEPADAVAVVALTPVRELVLVEQYRHGIRATTLELPGGVLHGDAPLVAAARELREETGFRADRLRPLATLDLNPSWQTQRIHLVLADEVADTGARAEDEAEDIRVHLLPLPRVRCMARDGEIGNAVLLAALLLLDHHLPDRSSGP